ncbi:MAG: hypothetical protein V4714_13040 [Bacteroidota bacterium]
MKSKVLPAVQKWLLASIFVSGLSGTLAAQGLSLTEDKTKTEDGTEIEAWTASLDQKEDYVRETFDKFIKQEYGLKTDKRAKNILIVDKAKIVEISSLRGDLRGVFSPRGTSTLVSFAFSPGYDIHLSKEAYPDELVRLGKIAKRYVKYHYNYYYKDLLANTEKQIRDKQDDINKNTSRISKAKSDIADNQTKIDAGDKQTPKLTDRNRKSNESITSMETENTNLQTEITQLKESITQIQASLKKVSEF